MPKLPPDRNPKHLKHATGQGVVYLSGRPHYTGRFGTPESDAKYLELIMRWNAGGRKALKRPDPSRITVAGLVERHRRDVLEHRRKRGELTSNARMNVAVSARFAALYGSMAADEVGLDEYLAFRDHVSDSARFGRKCTAETIGTYMALIRRIWLWGYARKLVPLLDWARPGVAPRLERGKSRKAARVRPADPASVDRVVLVARAEVAAMIRLQLLTGMRPGEVCALRPADLDRSGETWIYRVSEDVNKTEHHDRDRNVPIGPQARALLAPWLAACPDPGREVFLTRRRTPYDEKHYYQTIRHACDRLGVARFTPNQIRHTKLTEVRRKFRLEGSAAIGGHSKLETTQVYAERDEELGRRIAEETG